MQKVKQVNLYTDASVCEDHKVAGLGIVVEIPKTEERYTFSLYEEKLDDVNVAESLALLKGMQFVQKEFPNCNLLRIVCDNRGVVLNLIGKINTEGTKQKCQYNRNITRIKQVAKTFKQTKISHICGHKNFYSRYNLNNSLADTLSRDGIRKYFDDHNIQDIRYRKMTSYKNKTGGKIKE